MGKRGSLGSHCGLMGIFLLVFTLLFWQNCWGLERCDKEAGDLPRFTATDTNIRFARTVLVGETSLQPSVGWESSVFQPVTSDNTKRINSGKVFLRSLLLPGWGELCTGAKKRATGFLITEGLLWGAFAAFEIYAHWRENDYRDFAAKHADVQVAGKGKDYFTHLSFFDDIYQYNEEKRRLRRYDEVYPVDEEHFWQWDSQSSRHRFSSIRLSSQRAYRRVTLTIGVVLLNHLISAIDAIWVARGRNKELKSTVSWHIESHIESHSQDAPCFRVGLIRYF